jgi:hypothetical protein
MNTHPRPYQVFYAKQHCSRPGAFCLSNHLPTPRNLPASQSLRKSKQPASNSRDTEEPSLNAPNLSSIAHQSSIFSPLNIAPLPIHPPQLMLAHLKPCRTAQRTSCRVFLATAESLAEALVPKDMVAAACNIDDLNRRMRRMKRFVADGTRCAGSWIVGMLGHKRDKVVRYESREAGWRECKRRSCSARSYLVSYSKWRGVLKVMEWCSSRG